MTYFATTVLKMFEA